jgi:phospholipase/carboxylesterase
VTAREPVRSGLETVEIAPAEPAQRSVIWLHGLGADGHDFVPVVRQLTLPRPTRFVFPHAPRRPVTINGGLVMRAWYDIVSLDGTGPEDDAGIRSSAAAVQALIDAETERGIAAGRIVIAGFSQGGAIALHASLRAPQRLAGVIALSTYLPLADTLVAEHSDSNAGIPIFMAHGEFDPMIPICFARQSCEGLTAAGHAVEWHSYPMGHEVCPPEIGDIERWLAVTLA